MVNNVLNYLKHDVVTKVRQTNEFPTYFPAITICNLNYFQTDYSKVFLQNVATNYDLPNIFDPNAFNDSDYLTLMNYFSTLGEIAVVEQNLNQSEIQKLGYSIDEFLLNCQFSQNYCDHSEFAWFFHPNYGYDY